MPPLRSKPFCVNRSLWTCDIEIFFFLLNTCSYNINNNIRIKIIINRMKHVSRRRFPVPVRDGVHAAFVTVMPWMPPAYWIAYDHHHHVDTIVTEDDTVNNNKLLRSIFDCNSKIIITTTQIIILLLLYGKPSGNASSQSVITAGQKLYIDAAGDHVRGHSRLGARRLADVGHDGRHGGG